MKKTMTMMLLLLVAMTVSAKSWKTIVFTTQPQMHCAKCENRVKNLFKEVEGIKEIDANCVEQTVTITYNAKKTNPEALQGVLEKGGYKARELKEGEKIVSEPHECKEKKAGEGGKGC